MARRRRRLPGDRGDCRVSLVAQSSLRTATWYLAAYTQNRIRVISGATGIITTIAGNGNYGSSGDGGPAGLSELNTPTGLDIDAHGNLWIADSGNNRIRKITAATGTIDTVAGLGTYGYSGDGGPAASAEFRSPYKVTVTEAGELYVCDGQNHRIREIAEASAPAFTAQPSNKSTDVGGTVSFAAEVAGFPPPALTWQVSSNGTTWADLTNTAPYSGVLTPALAITGATADLNGLMYNWLR